MKTLLITGFEPFGGETVNPSWEAVRRLPETVGGWIVRPLRIPVVYGRASQAVAEAASQLHPDAILCVGQAGGRAGITPEAVAVNLREARIPDNAGNQPAAEPVVAGGPAAYFATVPVRRMVAALSDAGIPASLSLSAGSFVCNDVFYALSHRFHDTPVKVGFIHVPWLPEQAGGKGPCMTPEDMISGLQICIGALDDPGL